MSGQRKTNDEQPSADENSPPEANALDERNTGDSQHSSKFELDQLTQLWQQVPVDAEALLRSVRARSASQRASHYFEIGLTLLALGLLFNAMRTPMNSAMWFFVVVSLPGVIWLQWQTSKVRQSAHYVQAHDARSLLALAIKQCQAEIRLADLTRKCCNATALFGAIWLPWLTVISWPLQGRDRFYVPFAVIWWISWLVVMFVWAKRKHQRETERMRGLEAKVLRD